MLFNLILQKFTRYISIKLNKLYLLNFYLITILKYITYYLFFLFIYNLLVIYFYKVTAFIENYLNENYINFFKFLEMHFNNLKKLLYGTSDVHPALTGYDSFIILVKVIFYSFNIPLIVLMNQFPESFF